MSNVTSECVLPKLECELAGVTAADTELATRLSDRLRGAGVDVSDHALNELAAEVSSWRVNRLDMLGASYLALALFSANLHRKVRDVVSHAIPHPHGKEPRKLIFADELDALDAATKDAFTLPALSEAGRLNEEIRTLQKARRDADSAKATLQNVANTLSNELKNEGLSRLLELKDAAARVVDLAKTELREVINVGGAIPSNAELAACYYPVTIKAESDLADGDTLYEPESQTVLYQHGNSRYETTPDHVLRQLTAGGVVLLRPFGVQAVIALRLRLSTGRLKAVLQLEKGRSGPLHVGRSQGLGMAIELLSAPSWQMPPIVQTRPGAEPVAAVAKTNEANEASG